MMRNALAVATVAAITISLAWAANTPLDVKTGLWDMSYVTTTAKMPTPVKFTGKDCINAKDLEEGAFGNKDEDDKCKYTPLVATATHNESTVKCASGATGKMIVDALTREQIKSNLTMTSQGRTITIDIVGKWVNASCGALQ